MKLRLEHNSIRLRLSEPEVLEFLQHGVIRETICFGSGSLETLQYELLKTQEFAQLHAERSAAGLRIFFPSALASLWERDLNATWKYVQPLGNGNLTIVVEMDQDCRH